MTTTSQKRRTTFRTIIVLALSFVMSEVAVSWAESFELQAPQIESIQTSIQESRTRFQRQLEELAEGDAVAGNLQLATALRDSLIVPIRGKQLYFLPAKMTGHKDLAEAITNVPLRTELQHARSEFAGTLWRAAKQLAQLNPPRIAEAYALAHEAAFVDPTHEASARLAAAGCPGDGQYVAQPAKSRHKEYDWKAGSFWRVKTDHFLIVTDHSAAAAENAAIVLEELHCVWRQMFAALWLDGRGLKRAMDGAQLPRRRRQHKVVLFASRDEYIRRLQPAEPQVTMSTGMYRDVVSTSFFYVDEPVRVDVWRHEVTHQLFQEILQADPGVGNASGFWAVEAIALYLESARRGDGYYELGGIDARRLQYARYRALNEQYYVPIGALSRFGKQQLQSHADIRKLYSQSAGLAHFLMDGAHAAYRPAFIEYLGELYRLGARAQSLAVLAGVEDAQLDYGYHEYLKLKNGDLASVAKSPTADPVRALCLGHTNVTDKGIAFLQPLTELEWLDMTGCRITDAGIASLPNLKALRRLSLEGTEISDAICGRLARFTELEELDLSYTSITDAGLAQLATLQKLRSLWLTGASVTDEAVATLRQLKNLEHLNVNDTAVSTDAWQELQDSLPHLGSKLEELRR